MSYIPEDVMKAAKKCAGEWNLIDAIARAIFAERERSLQILSEETKKSRASALEEAAKVAETFKRKRLGRDLSKATFDPCGRWEGGEIYEEGKEKDVIASCIRALGHEPLSEPDLVDALNAIQQEGGE